jgi:hypothetical protein
MTTIEPTVPVGIAEPAAEDGAEQAALAERRYLDSIRRRVAWQSERAAALRDRDIR